MDQEPNGQCGQASESQPEVHGPLGGPHTTRGSRLWASLVSDVPGRPRFPKRGSLSGEGVVLVGNSIRVWSKFAMDPFSWKDSGSLCVYFCIRSRVCFEIYFIFLFLFFIVVDFVIHWNETAMGLHVFPIPIPPPTSLSTRSL